eukprot:TRINITY_DN11557_c0_g1_i1.p1 TRINITY_DN11557_c0_g1~~TRINITY_DN11557_c0_g1_i1.p1  ORF type:complete len:119 (-),score=32.03 TRINITY_DN11557_c0_g1_i1:46-402(-)
MSKAVISSKEKENFSNKSSESDSSSTIEFLDKNRVNLQFDMRESPSGSKEDDLNNGKINPIYEMMNKKIQDSYVRENEKTRKIENSVFNLYSTFSHPYIDPYIDPESPFLQWEDTAGT